MFCPQCQNLFDSKYCKASSLDGAYFGTTFPHLLLLHQKKKPQKNTVSYIPRIFGFRLAAESVKDHPPSTALPARRFCFNTDGF